MSRTPPRSGRLPKFGMHALACALLGGLGCGALPAHADRGDAAVPVVPATPPAAMQTVSHGRFVDVPVYRPAGAMQRFVVWFVDGITPAQRAARIAALTDDGALVAVVDTAALERALRADGERCAFSAGDVENFARYVQAYLREPTYRAAIVLGDGEGAALAYAVVAQADAGTFAGAVSPGFCPRLSTGHALCAGAALKLGPASGRRAVALQPGTPAAPWFFAADPTRDARCPAADVTRFAAGVAGSRALARDAGGDVLPDVRAAVRQLGARHEVSVPPPPADLSGLPVIEVPAGDGPRRDTFAVFASGDGGWAGLDKDVAAALAQAGIPVAGLDSLRYFWTRRTPQGFANDLDRIVRYYAHRWQRSRVLLIGFSQGADVLPAAINRLPAATKQRVALNTLLSIGKRADYEFHVANWLGGGDDDGLPIAPELARLPAARTLCVYGEDDDDAICPTLPPGSARVVKLPGDHHFNGDYERLAAEIVRAAQNEQ